MTKPALIDAIDINKDLQCLLDSAYSILKNPMLIHDTNFKLMVFNDVPVNDLNWKEITSTGTYSTETQELFSKLNILDDIANTDKYVILKNDRWNFQKMVGYVYNREHIKVAVLVLYASNAPIEPDDASAFEKFIDKISCKIRDDDYYIRFGRQLHQELIIKLLDRVIHEPAKYTHHVQILYDNFKDYIYTAVLDISHNSGRTAANHQEKLLYFKSIFESKFQLYKYAVYSDYLVIIMSSKYNDDNNEQFFDNENNFIKQNNLFIGMSKSFENLYELRKYYDQAVDALKMGLEQKNDQSVFCIMGTSKN